MRKFLVFASCVAVLFLVSVTDSSAQALYGSLTGTVTDTSGAAIPGATVVATQAQTNLKREVVSSEIGPTRFRTFHPAPTPSP